MEDLKVGFVGAGKMAQCLASGFIISGVVKPRNILMSAPSEKNLKEVKKLGYNVTHSNLEVFNFSSVIFLAVKPPHLRDILVEITSVPAIKSRLIISVVTGITLNSLTQILRHPFKVVRIVTNTGVQVRSGVTVFARDERVNEEDAALLMQLMSSVGSCTEAPESIFNAVTGVAGSGPAYVYLIIQAMADGAVKMGIPRQLALNLAVHTCLGASKMVIETGKHPGELQDEISSPGGTTIHGLHKLESSGVRGAIMSAVEAATQRADFFAGSHQF